ncbi:hypothetical protein [Tenacibaculum sp. IB213877]|uniref:hypothetical protein n=1 Tax=Tenacibaculum sp. IB213877 TaxID=3097351 RepID=UPI002A59E0F1|nr:hypothetical protein [Tenacibaculum sp. IB213877]MDY0781009.1 hypothetical protein [Tenacibaculum sp. IB213877]
MKQVQFLFLLMLCLNLFGQQTHKKQWQTTANFIELYTSGLDEIQILNSENDMIDVSLFDENPNSHYITTSESDKILKINFKLNFLEDESVVFRKFITKRLNRASAIVKIPQNKEIVVYGTNIGVISKNYKGDINIYIDKGFINLNTVQGNVTAKLFQGNVYATVKNATIHITSTNGNILINHKKHQKSYHQLSSSENKKFELNSINANVVLTTQ